MSNIKPIKAALAVNNVNEIQQLLKSQEEGNVNATATLHLYDRAFCDADVCVGTGIVQIIPYIVLYSFDPTTSVFSILTYTRPNKNSEQRLANKTSIGFGGHIDSDIQGRVIDAAGPSEAATQDVSKPLVSYSMTFDELIATLESTTIREVQEEIGLDIRNTEKISRSLQPYFFQEHPDHSDNVGKVHLAYCVPCMVTSKEELENILLNAKAQETEIEGLTIVNIQTAAAVPMTHRLSGVNSNNIGTLVDDLCSSLMTLTTEELQKFSVIFFSAFERSLVSIVQETSMENWSKIAFSTISRQTLCSFFGDGFQHVSELITANQNPVALVPSTGQEPVVDTETV